MNTIQRSLPRDVFLHLFMIATLYASVAAFLVLVFQYVNVIFPDTLGYYYSGITDAIRQSEATLIIVFPVYMFLSWLIGRDMAAAPDLRDFKLRKWLVYFTLFISAITIIIDLVALIYNFLGGDLTTPFVLKVCAVLAVAAAVFGYYLWDLRRKSVAPSGITRAAATATAAVVIASLVAGFFIVGSPASQRARRFDMQRVADLQTLQSQIVDYWMLKEKLPVSQDALTDSISGFSPPADPQNGQPYVYKPGEGLAFELCATFATEGDGSGGVPGYPRMAYPARPYGDQSGGDTWAHGAGPTCFSRAIDPELYRPQGKPAPAL